MTEYVLRIEVNKNNHSNITDILQIVPSDTEGSWEYSIDEDNDLYIEAIDHFMNLIEPNMQKFKKIGIESDDISVWFYKSYTGQCNMEFSPNEMGRLADNGIVLCISCWEE